MTDMATWVNTNKLEALEKESTNLKREIKSLRVSLAAEASTVQKQREDLEKLVSANSKLAKKVKELEKRAGELEERAREIGVLPPGSLSVFDLDEEVGTLALSKDPQGAVTLSGDTTDTTVRVWTSATIQRFLQWCSLGVFMLSVVGGVFLVIAASFSPNTTFLVLYMLCFLIAGFTGFYVVKDTST